MIRKAIEKINTNNLKVFSLLKTRKIAKPPGKISCIDNVTTEVYIHSMNTTIQIRIDKLTKSKAQKAFKGMGIDMSSGVKMFLNYVALNQEMHFVPSTKRTRAMRRKWDKEGEQALKHGKHYTSTEEMLKDIELGV